MDSALRYQSPVVRNGRPIRSSAAFHAIALAERLGERARAAERVDWFCTPTCRRAFGSRTIGAA